jgi:hypothetical protein
MLWFMAISIFVLFVWALWPLASLRSQRGREGEQQFVALEYSGLPVSVDLASIPTRESPRRPAGRWAAPSRGLSAQ